MADRYTKTDTGRDEIRARVHALTRTARNLLLIIDASKAGDQWIALVRGATADDLRTLFDAGLVAPFGAAAVASVQAAPTSIPPGQAGAATAGAAGAAAESAPASATTTALSYSDLYDLLPSLAKEHLGLLKGYRWVLAIEKASGLAGLQQVANDLVAEVERVKGPAVARSVKRALLLP